VQGRGGSKLRNWLLFLLPAFLWGLDWSAMKIGVSFAPPITFILQRFIVSAVSLSPVLFLLRKKVPRDSDTLGKLVILSLLNVSQLMAANIGLVRESSSIGAVLIYTYPLFVFCLAISFLKEGITLIKLLGVIVGFIGVVVLFSGRIGLLARALISLNLKCARSPLTPGSRVFATPSLAS